MKLDQYMCTVGGLDEMPMKLSEEDIRQGLARVRQQVTIYCDAIFHRRWMLPFSHEAQQHQTEIFHKMQDFIEQEYTKYRTTVGIANFELLKTVIGKIFDECETSAREKYETSMREKHPTENLKDLYQLDFFKWNRHELHSIRDFCCHTHCQFPCCWKTKRP